MKKGLLQDDREQYVFGGIASAISKAVSKKLPKSKLKKDLSQPTKKDFENVFLATFIYNKSGEEPWPKTCVNSSKK